MSQLTAILSVVIVTDWRFHVTRLHCSRPTVWQGRRTGKDFHTGSESQLNATLTPVAQWAIYRLSCWHISGLTLINSGASAVLHATNLARSSERTRVVPSDAVKTVAVLLLTCIRPIRPAAFSCDIAGAQPVTHLEVNSRRR